MNAVQPEWFDRLSITGLRPHYAWLQPLHPCIQKIANFGCMTGEPFVLLWTLDATEISVVEIDQVRLYGSWGPIEAYKMISKYYPEALWGRSIKFIVADMSQLVEELQSDYFDLAYCERVLYHMMPNLDQIQCSRN
jgi:hypothetical protein